MTIIQGGVSQVGANVGAVSQGLYGELVDASGRKIASGENYSVLVDLAPATTLTDGTSYFFMKTTGAKTALIRKVELTASFTGTAAASVSSYRIERFTGTTPTGGTALTPVKKKNTYSASTITAGFLNTGLTTSGTTIEPSFVRLSHMNQLATVPIDLNFTEFGEGSYFCLDVGEGLLIRANGALVAGTRLTGAIFWAER